jgi:FMN phosphatase YigB (HAD superfamily)
VTLLVLFDVDGTLLLTHDEVYVEANREALLAVWGSAPEGPDVPGDTATAHTRRALHNAGFGDEEIDAQLDRWCASFSERYVALLRDADTSHWRAPDHSAQIIAQVERRALLTGNPEPVAHARLRRLGLAGLFPDGQGAFGCEREDRVQLFELARERAGCWPAERTVAVGDTPSTSPRRIAQARVVSH